MSTYLVAFVVGAYDKLPEVYYKDTRIQVFTPLAQQSLGQFALGIALQSLKFYSEYFQIDYPLPKMDLVAVPVNESEVRV